QGGEHQGRVRPDPSSRRLRRVSLQHHDREMTRDAERIVDLEYRHTSVWDQDRRKSLFEKPWLDRFLALLPAGGSILDIGCGSAEPIAPSLIDAGLEVSRPHSF